MAPIHRSIARLLLVVEEGVHFKVQVVLVDQVVVVVVMLEHLHKLMEYLVKVILEVPQEEQIVHLLVEVVVLGNLDIMDQEIVEQQELEINLEEVMDFNG